MDLEYLKQLFSALKNLDDPLVSFSFYSVLYLLSALLLRSLLIGGFKKKLKSADKRVYKTIMRNYLKFSFVGWGLIFASWAFLVAVKNYPSYFQKYFPLSAFYAFVPALLILGIFFHLRAFTSAVLNYFVTKLEIEKN